MIKLLGAFCVMAGALYGGLGATRALRQRVEALEGLREGLCYLDQELNFRLTALPELLEQLGKKAGPAGDFFGAVYAQWQKAPEGGLRSSWRLAMTRCLSILRTEERQAILEVGQSLGRYDAQTQSKALSRAIRQLEGYRQAAREEARRLGRVYATLSIAGGAALVLVLL